MQIAIIPGFNPGPYTGEGNATYLLTGRVPTLIDAATGDPRHLERVAEALAGAELARVLVTHSHSDHASGAAALARRWPGAEFWKVPWPERDGRVSVPWRALRPDDVVPAGDGVLHVVHTPGHAPDHVCYFAAGEGVLFCGDLVVQGRSVLIPASRGGDLRAYIRSLETVRNLQPKRVMPAHGPEIDDFDRVVEQYLRQRQRREASILSELERGSTTDTALVDRLYGDVVGERRDAAKEMVLAHLVKLEQEGLVARGDDTWSLVSR